MAVAGHILLLLLLPLIFLLFRWVLAGVSLCVALGSITMAASRASAPGHLLINALTDH